MRKRVRIGLAVVVVAVVGVIAWQMARSSQSYEPTYQGKALSRWLLELDEPSTHVAADAALKEIGTNALPYLVRWLKATESPTETRFFLLLRRQPLPKLPWRTAGDCAQAAIAGFRALGLRAAPAVPAIIGLFQNSDLTYGGQNPAYQAARALAEIGPPAIEPLLQALTNQDAAVRYHACFALGYFPSLLTNTAVPALVARLEDTNCPVRTRACIALGALRQEPGLVVPALSRRLGDPASAVRFNAAIALGEFGDQASGALPALVKAFQEEGTVNNGKVGRGIIDDHSKSDVCSAISDAVLRIDPTVDVANANALKAIDPEAAAKAGVK